MDSQTDQNVNFEAPPQVPSPAPTTIPNVNTAVVAASPSRGKSIARSVMGIVVTLVAFFIMQSLGMLISVFVLAIIMNYSVDSGEAIQKIIVQESGFVSLTCQILELIALVVIWLIIRRRSIMRAKAAHVSYESGPGAVALRIGTILLLGLMLQLCLTGVYGFLVNAIPAIAKAYEELSSLINDSLTDSLGQISAAFGAPLVEELLVRGLVFEFLLRIFQKDFPEWQTKAYPQKGCLPQIAPTTSTAAFWIANVLQALVFAIVHLNFIQGTYAFGTGLILGWVYWRTGKMRYSMLLHFGVNGSSLFVGELLTTAGLASEVPTMIVGFVSTALVAVLIVFFKKKTEPQSGFGAHALRG